MKTINELENAITTALGCYTEYCEDSIEFDSPFVSELAKKSLSEKRKLRELLRNSPNWDEDLDSLVIHSTRDASPDWDYVSHCVRRLYNMLPVEKNIMENRAAFRWFYNQDDSNCLEYLNFVAPKAYAPNKKPSKILRALCQELGIVDDTAGSEWQKRFALAADSLSVGKVDFDLIVSVNPGHFLTISNPHGDSRGDTLVSCHSLNSDYDYKNGNVGYATDEVTMVAFTVENLDNEESLCNRKTSRQLFMYQDGVLVQSRMYNSCGGTRGRQEASKDYREIIQKEISYCEEKANLWHTRVLKSDGWVDDCLTLEKKAKYIVKHNKFSGYADWEYSDFDPRISFNKAFEKYRPMVVGNTGLCFDCGRPTEENIYCDECGNICADCGNAGVTYTVLNGYNEEVRVCSNCRDDYYRYCDDDDRYHIEDSCEWVDCEDCYYTEEYVMNNYTWCEADNSYVPDNDVIETKDTGTYASTWYAERNFYQCNDCDEWYENLDELVPICNKDEEVEFYCCEYCAEHDWYGHEGKYYTEEFEEE